MSWLWHKQRLRPGMPDWNAPATSSDAARLEALYGWERVCRSYDLYSGPVGLEPPFVPYASGQFIEPSDPELHRNTDLSHFSLRLLPEQKLPVSLVESFLSSLRAVRTPLCFEIVADAHEVGFHLAVEEHEAELLSGLWQAHFAPGELEAERDALLLALHALSAADEERQSAGSVGYAVVEFGLAHLSYLPLRSFSSFSPDPLAPLVAALGQLRTGEVAGVQLRLIPARQPWSESLLRVAQEFSDENTAQNTHFHAAHESGAVACARRKLESPLWAATLRLFAASSRGEDAAFALCQKVGSGLDAFSTPEGEQSGNALLALDDTGYPDAERLRDLILRRSRRAGMLLSSRELLGLVRPPSEHLRHPKLVRLDPSQQPLPDFLTAAKGDILGVHTYRNEQQPVVWPDAYRNRHLYTLGATRMGKSTLLLNLIAQDLSSGRGLCLLDPHGDLAQDVLALVPPERQADVLYLNLGDREHPVALGLLDAKDEWKRRLLCADTIAVLHRLFASSWGDRIEHVLRHVLLTLLSQPGHTLRDVRPLLSDKSYREGVLAHVTDPELQAFWRSEFPSYSASTFGPLYNKLGLLLSSPLVRNIVAQRESRLSLAGCMDESRVLLVNLNRGALGEDAAHFLGALLVSKLQIAAMARLRQERGSRRPFTLYVDEFQQLVVGSFESILSEAGKAGLHLVLANQFLEQLSDKLQTAILSNAGTLVSFRVSAESGRRLEREFAGRFTSEDAVSLNRGEVLCRIGSAEGCARLHTLPPPTPNSKQLAAGMQAEIVARTREECCRPRAEIEAEMLAIQEPEAEQPEKTKAIASEAATSKAASKRQHKSAASKGESKAEVEKEDTPEKENALEKENASESVKTTAVEIEDSQREEQLAVEVERPEEVETRESSSEPDTFAFTEPVDFGVPDESQPANPLPTPPANVP